MSDCETEISGGGSVSVGAARVALVCQLIASRFPRLDEISVLDLASDEGAFSRELAQQGAEVVSIEGREASHQRAREIRDDENLDRWTTYCADVIEVDLAEHGPYDVVLCLGFLYHLRAGDAVRLLRRIAAVCSGITIVETQISTESVTAEFIGERSYHGRPYREDPVHDGDALAAYDSFWFTGRSLLDAFADAGFGLVTEVQSPRPHLLNRYRDHGWWVLTPAREIPEWSRALLGGTLLEPNPPATGAELVHPANASRRRRRAMQSSLETVLFGSFPPSS